MAEKTQERMIDMINKFGKLPYEDQIFVSGIIQGMYIKKESKVATTCSSKKVMQA